jgi:hypothetical protein
MLKGEIRGTQMKTCHNAKLSAENPICLALDTNQGLRCEKPETNLLSYSSQSSVLGNTGVRHVVSDGKWM